MELWSYGVMEKISLLDSPDSRTDHRILIPVQFPLSDFRFPTPDDSALKAECPDPELQIQIVASGHGAESTIVRVPTSAFVSTAPA